MNIPLLICIHIFLYSFIFINTELVIPFESKLCIGNEKEDILSKYYNQYLYTPIIIGSKNQRLEVALKLNRYITYLISSKNSGLKSDFFNEGNSNTYEKIDDKKIQSSEDEFISGIKSNDNFIFGNNINFQKYLFYLSQEQRFDETGHIGLKMAPSYLDKDFSGNGFIHQLKSKGLINSNSFYFKYEFKDEEEFKYKGNLIIGGMPHEIEPSKLFNKDNYVQVYANINEYNTRWNIKLASVSYGAEIVSRSDTAKLSTTFGLIEAPINFLSIFDIFFNKTKCYTNYNGENKYYLYIYCDKSVDVSKFKDLFFTTSNNELNFTLTYKDLFRKIGNYYYFLILFNEDIKEWNFGHIFLKKYVMVFDIDKKTIGYYYQGSKKNEQNNKKYINYTSVVMCIVFGFIIVWLLLYIFYIRPIRNRRMRANELELSFNYSSSDEDKEKANKLGV